MKRNKIFMKVLFLLILYYQNQYRLYICMESLEAKVIENIVILMNLDVNKRLVICEHGM